ncbi:MAG: DUF63 family protein [Candidatus Aenigmarchaeota archaeon]|nr:DUF63 family protein [Candidatus Aenigmarchaeota archaeon]
MALSELIATYYVNPIIYGTGYNIVNTLTYALVLVAAAFGTYRLLQRMRITVDRDFFIGIAPFIALGGMLRALEDYYQAAHINDALAQSLNFIIYSPVQGKYLNLLLITPVMYFTMFIIALVALLAAIGIASLARKQRVRYHHVWFAIGAALIAAVALQYKITDGNAALMMLGVFGAWVALALLVKQFVAPRFAKLNAFMSAENTFLMLVHLFDASTTFVSLQFYPYVEQHVVPQFFIGIFGPIAMFFIKLPVVALVLYYLDKDLRHEKEKRNFIKIVVMILGLGPGLRNFFRLAMQA